MANDPVEFVLPPDSDLLVHTNEDGEYIPLAQIKVSLKDRVGFLLSGQVRVDVQQSGQTRVRLEQARLRDLPLHLLDWLKRLRER